ncbi:MAG: hypothetical protein N3E50_08970 [Candidatus Goldbacteria bacterium]|nr:hypothetical protein [Candidatus Goldiibacteriota bacterium]
MSDVSAVSSAYSSYTYSTSYTDNPSSVLDKDDFLQMLITKLKYQDPLDPADDDFAGDLAQYSTLEQLQNLNDQMEEMSGNFTTMNENIVGLMTMENTTQSLALVGKSVTIEYENDDGVTEKVKGIVDSIKFVDGTPKIVIDGIEYNLSDITQVSS